MLQGQIKILLTFSLILTEFLFSYNFNYAIIIIMLNKLNDTNPKAEKIQISLLQKAGTAKRASTMISLSQTTINLSKRAILRAHPNYNEKEINIAFVRLHYGKDLADRLKKYLNSFCP